MFELLKWKKTSWNFIGFRRIAYVLSTVLVIMGLVGLVQIIRGKAVLGVDFSGGTLIQVPFRDPDIGAIREAMAKGGWRDVTIQVLTGERQSASAAVIPAPTPAPSSKDKKAADKKSGPALPAAGTAAPVGGRTDTVMIRMPLTDISSKGLVAQVIDHLDKSFPDRRIDRTQVSNEEVGPAVGKQLWRQAMWAVLWAVIGILVYIWFRFEFSFGVTATLAVTHDVLATIGLLWLLEKEFTFLIVTALLTLAGYSLTDTVVVFDRIRENMRMRKKETLGEIINKSINEVLSRTIVTSSTVICVLVPLYFLGGNVIHDFSLAMIFGIFVGTYSSVYVASPLLLEWQSLTAPKPPSSQQSQRPQATPPSPPSQPPQGGQQG